MISLSPLLLWLLPLAALPVIIHLLNRLRYQTVRWAAMMFLRSADRDASRRAKIRQWLILAVRCLMLLFFILALARLQSQGRLARFFDPGADMVVILFDRSASMEHLRGGTSGRERALDLLRSGLEEAADGARVLWVDSATGEVTPVPSGMDPERLPMTVSTSTSADTAALLRTALREISRAEVARAEIWIPTDRQSRSWIPEGTESPDWEEWAGLDTRVTLRLLDVAGIPAKSGNRTLQIEGRPEREGDQLRVGLRMVRDRVEPESVALRLRSGGLTLREDIMVEGREFRWEQLLPLEAGADRVDAFFSVPSDANPADNEVAVAWRDPGRLLASLELDDAEVDRVMRASILPDSGRREVAGRGRELDRDTCLWIRDGNAPWTESQRAWLREGGVLLTLPRPSDLEAVSSEGGDTFVTSWTEQTGVLATEQREPLRMDLVRVRRAVSLEPEEGTDTLALLDNGWPLLTRRSEGRGAEYHLATLPTREASNLAAGYVLVPVVQRLLREGARKGDAWGIRTLGEWVPEAGERWEPLDGEGRDPRLHPGRYRLQDQRIALNRPTGEDAGGLLTVEEVRAWAAPLDLRVFGDDRIDADAASSRVDFTSLLALAGLGFLVVESWLLTRNIRRRNPTQPAWGSAS